MTQTIPHELYTRMLHDWVADELCEIYKRPVEPAPAGTLMIGCAVWGKTYINRFLNWTAKTLQADMGALRGRTRLVLFTGSGGFDDLWLYARRMQADGVLASGNTPAQFAALIEAEHKKWAEVVKASGAKVD